MRELCTFSTVWRSPDDLGLSVSLQLSISVYVPPLSRFPAPSCSFFLVCIRSQDYIFSRAKFSAQNLGLTLISLSLSLSLSHSLFLSWEANNASVSSPPLFLPFPFSHLKGGKKTLKKRVRGRRKGKGGGIHLR